MVWSRQTHVQRDLPISNLWTVSTSQKHRSMVPSCGLDDQQMINSPQSSTIIHNYTTIYSNPESECLSPAAKASTACLQSVGRSWRRAALRIPSMAADADVAEVSIGRLWPINEVAIGFGWTIVEDFTWYSQFWVDWHWNPLSLWVIEASVSSMDIRESKSTVAFLVLLPTQHCPTNTTVYWNCCNYSVNIILLNSACSGICMEAAWWTWKTA